MVVTASEPLTTKSPAMGKKIRRLASAVRAALLLATVVALVGWGVFAMTIVIPNPNDSSSVFGAFHATSFQWGPEPYNISAGSTVVFVFDIRYTLTGGGCNGYFPTTAARNGSWVASCILPRPNSTVTSRWADYVSFNIDPDRKCCRQSYWNWVSGPSGNLTNPQGGGGFFEVNQEGNYSAHVSNTIPLYPGAVAPGNVNGTLTFNLGHVLFSRPYFAAGLATLGLGVLFSSQSIYSLSIQRRKERSSIQRESADRLRGRQLPPEQSD